MKGLYQPKGKTVWMFRYSWNGKQHRVSLQTRDEAEAVRKAMGVLAAPALEETGDYEAEIEKYFATQRKDDRLSVQSVEARRYLLPQLFRQSGKNRVAAITTADVQRWYDLKKCGEDTRQTYVRWVRAFYKWLIQRNRVRENPCKGVKIARLRPAARKSTVTKADVSRLIAACDEASLKFVLFCGFHAGMRKGEVIEARPEWFDLQSGHIHIDVTPTWIPKDRERRTVPISKAFTAFLKDYGLPSPYMLAPEVKPGKSVYRYDFERAYKNLLRKTGIKCTFHDARRTFASQLVSAGVSVYKVARWLGDGVAVVEKHYGHLQPDNGDLERGFA